MNHDDHAKKHGRHAVIMARSCHGSHVVPTRLVIYKNIEVIESTIEVYGNMQVIKRPYYSMIPYKSYTVP